MAYPLVTVEFSPTTNPLASPSWVDITNKIIGQVVWSRGRGSELDEFPAGSATFTLQDPERAFDSSNTSGTYSPNIKPRKKVRIRQGATTLFTGYVQVWDTAYDLMSKQILTTVTCTDAIGLLGMGALIGSPYSHAIRRDGPAAYYSMRDLSIGAYVADDSFAGTYPGALQGDYIAKSESNADGLSPAYLASKDTAGATGHVQVGTVLGTSPPSTQSIELWMRTDTKPQGGGSDYASHIYSFSGSALVNELDSSSPDAFGRLIILNTGQLSVSQTLGLASNGSVKSGVWNHVVVTCDGSNVKFYINGVLDVTISSAQKIFSSTTGTGLSGYTIGASPAGLGNNNRCRADIKEVSFWTKALTQAEITAHYEAGLGWAGDFTGERIERLLDLAGWPDADRDIDQGNAVVAPMVYLPGSPLEAIKQLVSAEHGALWSSKAGSIVFKSRYAFNEDSNSRNTQSTYGHSGSDLRYEAATPSPDDLLLFNVVTTSIAGSDSANVFRDETSITSFFEIASFDKTGLELASNADAIAVGQLILNRHKSLTPRISRMVVNVRQSAGNMTAALARELWDRIVVKHKPNNVGADITYTEYVESIVHTVDFSTLDWRMEMTLSPIYSQTFFVIGTDSVGGSAVIAY